MDRGDLLPSMVVDPPGPHCRALAERQRRAEAPGINTLFRDEPSLAWAAACGANVVDLDGNRYLDLCSGFGACAVGHRHPRVLEAVRRQSERLLHGLGDVHGHLPRLELAERLGPLTPVDDPVVYFAVSGSDAVEIALKTAHLATGRPGLVAFEPAYHGLGLGALAATSREAFRRPFVDRRSPPVLRLPYGVEPARLREALRARRDLGAVLVEPIVGREGIILPPSGWLRELASICRETGTVFVVDEILTGFGRTGALFVSTAEGVRPDLLCCGKALGGGLPLAAVVARRELMDAWRSPGEARHTATFVAHPLACAAAIAVLDVLEEEELVARAARLGRGLAERLGRWQEHPGVRGVRGRGLLWGIEMHRAEKAAAACREALRKGLIVLAGGPRGAVLELLPPLTVSQRQLDAALSILDRVIASQGGEPP